MFADAGVDAASAGRGGPAHRHHRHPGRRRTPHHAHRARRELRRWSSSVGHRRAARRAPRVLHISGYSILDGFGMPGARDLIDRATAAGVPVSVTPGSSGYIDDFGAGAVPRGDRGHHGRSSRTWPRARCSAGRPTPERIGARPARAVRGGRAHHGRRGADRVRGQDAARACRRRRSSTSSTRPGPATRSPPASSTGGYRRATRSPPPRRVSFVAARAIMVMGGRPPI